MNIKLKVQGHNSHATLTTLPLHPFIESDKRVYVYSSIETFFPIGIVIIVQVAFVYGLYIPTSSKLQTIANNYVNVLKDGSDGFRLTSMDCEGKPQ
jgi:hypothetical protein